MQWPQLALVAGYPSAYFSSFYLISFRPGCRNTAHREVLTRGPKKHALFRLLDDAFMGPYFDDLGGLLGY